MNNLCIEEVVGALRSNRGQFLRLGVAGVVGTVGAGLLAGPACRGAAGARAAGRRRRLPVVRRRRRADEPRVVPQRARSSGFSAGERRRLQQAATAKSDHIARINAALGADAIQRRRLRRELPGRRVRHARPRARAGPTRSRRCSSASTSTARPSPATAATRLLLGRLLAYDAQQLAWLRGADRRRSAGAGLPNPLSLEQAGTTLDRLVTTPNFPIS